MHPKSFFGRLSPPPAWRVPVILILGIACGLLLQIFYVSNALSYLSDEPEACVNCHVMSSHFATWEHSSHRRVTTCNDCHVPHDNIIREYYFHAMDGLRHSTIFTLRAEPQVLLIKEAGKAAVQQNCLRCHINQVNPVSAANVNGENYKLGYGKPCWECHREVPHGRYNSQASTPYARVPVKRIVVSD
ncbi:MAG: cytochrome c nitrite reductase small subunit [Ignavibacteria bacterium GWB2_35_12]|nr:MAG: cytochrome c nitrite reductase small subunit [Ignavibacteria bacterium GWA2_35_8]OGU41491.1 MAG: cytochrome c nitrite reductase small subunit [Ignavibacteria bacterium GWB2_35_12]OGU92979.1 MAG: cytochrome c nitrite reductase small subunit [Ignavibacteria bacterium RIFOXYA2_FULL_35_10]OGV22965.1 MAG: cytochrome c nitrite reductase small subunit [Ignavibacteria bacterium RIFOXYC2_FULL_35_21]